MARRQSERKLLGVGLDTDDGPTRITRADSFHLVGGSKETHERMQEKCIRFSEKLASRGKSLEQLECKEFLDLAGQCDMNVVELRQRRARER